MMRDPGAKLIQYIQSGFHIKSCSRSRGRRVLQLEAPILSLYRPRLKLTDAQYQKAMRRLIAWLAEVHVGDGVVEICTSHYGSEWVELRNRQGKVKSRMALSVRAIDSLKKALTDAATRQVERTLGEVGADPAARRTHPPSLDVAPDQAEFPRVLPRRPAIANQDVPEQWRSKDATDTNRG